MSDDTMREVSVSLRLRIDTYDGDWTQTTAQNIARALAMALASDACRSPHVVALVHSSFVVHKGMTS